MQQCIIHLTNTAAALATMTALAPVIEKSSTQGVKVDAAIVAKPFRDEIKTRVKELKKMGIGTCHNHIHTCSAECLFTLHLSHTLSLS